MDNRANIPHYRFQPPVMDDKQHTTETKPHTAGAGTSQEQQTGMERPSTMYGRASIPHQRVKGPVMDDKLNTPETKPDTAGAGTSQQQEVGHPNSTPLVDQVRNLFRNVPPLQSGPSIFKVPVYLRSVSHACYTPKLVSLGPLHHGDEKLLPMTVYKLQYARLLFDQTPDLDLDFLIQGLKGLERFARKFYEHQVASQITSDLFVELMLLDGCFLIMFILLSVSRDAIQGNEHNLFTQSQFEHIYYDMLLLENQIPYFVLEELFNYINSSHVKRWATASFSQLVDDFFKDELQSDQVIKFRSSGRPIKHFVDYVLKCNLPTLPANQTSPPSQGGRKVINLPSATKLQRSGIKFAKGTSNCFLDVKFTNAVLEIPTLCLTDFTETRFRNMIAVEQCSRGETSYITHYMHLMDSLIDTPDDVALLRSCGILDNILGSDEEAAQTFNNMIKGATVDIKASYYYTILEEVSAHYNKQWNLWKAKLREDYFNSPWAIISFQAAFVLLICTIVQTVFTVLSASE